MKKVLPALICLLTVHLGARAQKDSLRFDENNAYVYYKVIDKPGFSADTLYKRAWHFAQAGGYKVKIEALPDAFTINGKFLIYNGVSLIRKESGEISYALFVETKEGKYRYKLGNFVLTPYKRDRFGNMVAVPGINIPLEKLLSKYSQKETDLILEQTGQFSIATGHRLESFVQGQPAVKPPAAVKKVATDKW